MRGRWGLLIAVVVGGVGLVLFLLGFDGHTTEALPFGVAMLIAATFIARPSLLALRAATKPEGAWTPKAGVSADVPPSHIRCESCGSPVPLSLAQTTQVECAHCHRRHLLPPLLAKQLQDAAAAVKSQAQSERQIAAVIASLPARETKLRAQLVQLTGALVAGAALAGLWGVARRLTDDTWHGFATFAVIAGPVSLALGLWAARAVPRITLGIVSRWTALKLPGVKGLACRCCGAPLPDRVEPVLRCDYCGADSLASPAVLARVEQQAEHARTSVLSVNHQSRDADERAAFSLVALPAIVLVVWFGIGAAMGGVVLRALGAVQLAPDETPHFAYVDGCVAFVDGDRLHFSYEDTRTAKAPAPLFAPSTLVGKNVIGRGVVERVYREVARPGRHIATTTDGLSVYLPSPYGGGELVCLQ